MESKKKSDFSSNVPKKEKGLTKLNKEKQEKKNKHKKIQTIQISPKQIINQDELSQEVFKQINNQIQDLSPTDRHIMSDMVSGYSDKNIIDKYNISKEYLTSLRSNPSFTHELKQLTYSDTLAFEDKQIAFTSRLAQKAYDAAMLNSFDDVAPDKLIKMYSDLIKQLNDKTSGTQANLDITVQLKQQIGEDRIQKDQFGRLKIKPKYSAPDIDDEEYMIDKPTNPVINNETGLVETNEVDYDVLEKQAMDDWE